MLDRHPGPNVRELIAHRLAHLLGPLDVDLPDAVMIDARERATVWTMQVLDEVKACEINPHGNRDESIAKAILVGLQGLQWNGVRGYHANRCFRGRYKPIKPRTKPGAIP